MISIIEPMVKKIHLNNFRNVRSKTKDGLTLIEVVCSLAIIAILFLAISSLIIYSSKGEVKTDNKLDNLSYSKAIMDIISNKNVEDYDLSKDKQYYYLGFNTIDELQRFEYFNSENTDEMTFYKDNKISKNSAKKLGKKYVFAIDVKDITKDTIDAKTVSRAKLFYIKVTIWNMERDNDNELYKEIYVTR